MEATLRKRDDGWILETSDGTQVDSGSYPLVEDDKFIESAAEALIDETLDALNHDQGKVPEHAASKRMGLITVGQKPYQVVDERTETS